MSVKEEAVFSCDVAAVDACSNHAAANFSKSLSRMILATAL